MVGSYTVNAGTYSLTAQNFDAWGNWVSGTGTGTISQFGYTGREPNETGLVYYRARYYNPAIGRFTSRDPSGLSAGINLYAYANNNPVNFNDPSGLTAQSPLNSMFAAAINSYYNNLNNDEIRSAVSEVNIPTSFLVADNEGIVYLRTGPNGECYVGSSCSAERYIQRQAEHDRATQRINSFDILKEGISPDELRFIEEQKIRENGGPVTQGGTLENKRYEMNSRSFEERGGTIPKPTELPGIKLPGLLMFPSIILDFIDYYKMMNDPCYNNPFCA